MRLRFKGTFLIRNIEAEDEKDAESKVYEIVEIIEKDNKNGRRVPPLTVKECPECNLDLNWVYHPDYKNGVLWYCANINCQKYQSKPKKGDV